MFVIHIVPVSSGMSSPRLWKEPNRKTEIRTEVRHFAELEQIL